MEERDVGWDIAGVALRSVLTLLAAAILVLEANGYLIDFNRLRAEKAGLLVLETRPADAKAMLDGNALPLRRGQLTTAYFPDMYRLDVVKDGYHPWHHTVRIERGHVAVFDGIVLFPRERPVTGARPATTAEAAAPLVGSQLRVTSGEVWYQSARTAAEQLVTRLSVPIQAAVLLDKAHVLYQVRSGVHVVDLDGTNDVLLIDQALPDPARMTVADGGRTVLLTVAGTTTSYRVQ